MLEGALNVGEDRVEPHGPTAVDALTQLQSEVKGQLRDAAFAEKLVGLLLEQLGRPPEDAWDLVREDRSVLELLDADSNLAIVSKTASAAPGLLATYRCQERVNRLEMCVRTSEGRYGSLQAYVWPRISPKMCKRPSRACSRAVARTSQPKDSILMSI